MSGASAAEDLQTKYLKTFPILFHCDLKGLVSFYKSGVDLKIGMNSL